MAMPMRCDTSHKRSESAGSSSSIAFRRGIPDGHQALRRPKWARRLRQLPGLGAGEPYPLCRRHSARHSIAGVLRSAVLAVSGEPSGLTRQLESMVPEPALATAQDREGVLD